MSIMRNAGRALIDNFARTRLSTTPVPVPMVTAPSSGPKPTAKEILRSLPRPTATPTPTSTDPFAGTPYAGTGGPFIQPGPPVQQVPVTPTHQPIQAITRPPTTSTKPMSLAINRFSAPSGPGIGTAIGQIGGAIVKRGTDWAIGQIFGGQRGGAPATNPPTIPMPAGPGEMGLGGSIGRVGSAVGGVVRAVGGSKKVRTIVGGVLGWWLVDKVTGAILAPTSAPHRRMNVLNLRALKRADRRVDGFVKVARKALSSTGFKVERRGKSCAPKRKRCK